MENPRIYVMCLAAYKQGIKHGAWISATKDVEEMASAIRIILAASPVQPTQGWLTYAIEGFGDVCLKDFEQLEIIAKLASHAQFQEKPLVQWSRYALNKARQLFNL